ncbi:choice-of-anchor C domain-containing protein [Kitasatospora sp. MAP12-15]|uniref:choice-of-anchor C family protein n=1 Tax=unclassified Kitasatospora TaxID=2633591 RepID=UPI0024764C79|nr:choice-of-anchor C family protein [Kitasatospora sp. MAP12-44]MDH6108492.1 choice-of-anchor C domain-containing protein [Kitasatospora sp. MAP12-44]
MFVKRACVIAATSVLLAGLGVTASAQTVSRFDDGSFEYPRVAVNSYTDLSAGQTIGPWTVTAGTVDLIGAGFWQAAEGDQSVDLNGVGPGAVAQTFTTVPGANYTVTYALAGNPAGPPILKTGSALIDGQDFQDFSFDTAGKSFTNMGYVNRQFTFQATNSATTIGFASTTPNSPFGPVVDDVRIERCAPCPTCSNG